MTASIHALKSDSSAPAAEGDSATPSSTERPGSAQHKRIASRMIRRELESREVSLTEAAECAGLTKQRLGVLLDGEHHAPLDVVAALALNGGRLGADVARGVAHQLLALADGGSVVAPHASAADGIATLAKELGEYAAAALQHGTPATTLRKELTDLIDAGKRELARLDATT